jgi:hypothetical protein
MISRLYLNAFLLLLYVSFIKGSQIAISCDEKDTTKGDLKIFIFLVFLNLYFNLIKKRLKTKKHFLSMVNELVTESFKTQMITKRKLLYL